MHRLVMVGLAVLVGCGNQPDDESSAEQPPTVVDAVAGIVRAFDNHAVVAIGETHGNAELAVFLEAVLSNQAIRAQTHTLAVEVGASAQAEIDAYLAGSLDDESLLGALRESIFSETGAADPAAVELYRVVRDLNNADPSGVDWSIVAVDSPLQWSAITEAGALEEFDREADMSDALGRLVEGGQSVLWVVGGAHLAPGVFEVPATVSLPAGPIPNRTSMFALDQDNVPTAWHSTRPQVPADADTVMVGSASALFETAHPGQLFVIQLYTGFRSRTAELEERLGPVQSPSLILVDASWLETEPNLELGASNAPRDVITGSPAGVVSTDDAAHNALVGVDGLLYLGRCDELSARLPPDASFDDPEYVAEINRRLSLRGGDTFDETEYRTFLASIFGDCGA